MKIRGFILSVIFFASLVGLLGCGSASSTKVALPDVYPVRSDWLVAQTLSPTQQPTSYYEPGYPPILQLNKDFKTLTGIDAILASRVASKEVLNAAKLSETERQEFSEVLTQLFGTPEKPRVAVDLAIKLLQADLASAEKKLALAKSEEFDEMYGNVQAMKEDLVLLQGMTKELQLDEKTLEHGGRLYRNYCQQCHGFTGDGNGPGARSLVPNPRDYRQGLFKFISSDPLKVSGRKPLRSDLERTIVHGLDGSAMPSFSGLSKSDIQAIISYVTHLSIRGESEYRTIRMVLNDVGNFNRTITEQVKVEFAMLCRQWIRSQNNPIVPDPNPYQTEEQILESAANGQKLFIADEKTGGGAGCATCHVQYGRGDYFKFDDWGTIVRPRNLTVATLRGGRKPEQIYARIYGGILGSNMPNHTRLRPTLEDRTANKNKLWDLVHFVQYVSTSEGRQKLKDKFGIEIDQ